MAGEQFFIDEVVSFGDPWHGLATGSTLALPGGLTMPLPGPQPVGGDCYVVQVPGQPAVTTPAADTALGMTWLNYGLMAGSSHALYGVALGNDKWIYIDSGGLAWLATLTLNIGTGAGSVAFRRFGVFPDDGAGVVQAATFTISGTLAGNAVRIDDIAPDGSGVAIVTATLFEEWPGNGAIKTQGYRDIGGAFEIVISGDPPSASVTATLIANATQAAGSTFDTLSRSSTNVSGTFGHQNKLYGLVYIDGVVEKVLRRFESSGDTTVTLFPVGSDTGFSGIGHWDFEYELALKTGTITLSGYSDHTKSGIVGQGGDSSYSSVLSGTNGFSYSETLVASPSVDEVPREDFLFTNAGDTDNYFFPLTGPDDVVALWPLRLANGLYGLTRFRINATTYNFTGKYLDGLLTPTGAEAGALSTSVDTTLFFGSRQPVSGNVVINAGTSVVYR